MQNRQRLSKLRQKLILLHQRPKDDLSPFLSEAPLVKGTVYPLRRKCSKVSCHCFRGILHETQVLTASIGGRTRLWSIPEDRLAEIRQKAENYRRYRQARAAITQRQREMVNIMNAIERIRTQKV